MEQYFNSLHGPPTSVGPSISARFLNFPQTSRSNYVPLSASAIHRIQNPQIANGQYVPNISLVPMTPQLGMIGQSFQDHKRLIERFRHKLGKELESSINNLVAKNYKFEISKYKGEDNYDTLEDFCIGLFHMMRILHLCGMNAKIDEDCVEFIGNNLKGKVSDWFNQEVDVVVHGGNPMRTVDVVHELYNRFIHHSTATAAVEKFHACKFDSEEGVATF